MHLTFVFINVRKIEVLKIQQKNSVLVNELLF